MSIQAYLVKVLLVVTYLWLLLWCHLIIDKSPGSLYIDKEPKRGTSHPLMEPVRIFCCNQETGVWIVSHQKLTSGHITPDTWAIYLFCEVLTNADIHTWSSRTWKQNHFLRLSWITATTVPLECIENTHNKNQSLSLTKKDNCVNESSN